jgi:hypothetical protein
MKKLTNGFVPSLPLKNVLLSDMIKGKVVLYLGVIKAAVRMTPI